MSEDRKALDRAQQYLANERTFLSWLRTSIALVGLGFIIARFGFFLREFQLLAQVEGAAEFSRTAETSFSSVLGVSMVALGVALIIYSLKSYMDGNKEIQSGTFVPKKGIVYSAAILLAVFGGIIVIYLLIVSLL
jgi:putative membrane protein